MKILLVVISLIYLASVEGNKLNFAEEEKEVVTRETPGARNWMIGDGVGGTEQNQGRVASKEACYLLCYHRQRNGVLANGATVDTKTGTKCYCEFGMTGRNHEAKWMSTFMNRANWRVGDGVGGSEVKIGVVQSRDHCYAMCRSRTQYGVFANGATVDSATGKTCYCEFGMSRRNSNTKWTSTFINGANWRVGDGVGGSEVKIGVVQSRDHCCTICRSQSKNGVFANGATVDSATGTICYCEFGMSRRNSNSKWTSTFIDGVQVSHDEPEKEFEDSSDVEDIKEEEALQETSAETDNIATEDEIEKQERMNPKFI